MIMWLILQSPTFELALKKAALYLCHCLLADRAVLLPTLYNYQYMSKIELWKDTQYSLVGMKGSMTGDLMSSVCHHRKIGWISFEQNRIHMFCSLMHLPVNTPHQMTHRVLTKGITVLLHVLIRSTNSYTELYHTC